MFRLWAKIFKDNRMLRDTVICDDSSETRTHKVFNALDEICYQFDLGKPMWLDATIHDFKPVGALHPVQHPAHRVFWKFR